MTQEREAKQIEFASLAVTDIIRKRSEEGRFVLHEEIRARLTEMSFLQSGEQLSPLDVLKQAREEHGDLKEIEGKDGIPRYYSSIYMSEKYVKILMQKGEDPLLMIAEIVRENSKIYPRPIPLSIFEESPFEFSKDDLLDFLKRMTGIEGYQDIAQTTTSIGTVYLYSTHYLEPDYASTLAEWFDVGQANNP
ncbi:MAG: hypothetical protein A2157_18875 [Deltaproteobacteria bacterium RBG_16_47_11]|nr:MAG: hypothetical protein A2157_18875 [Deltaproteobacteria bacterium RBG_16_47_11]